MTPVSASLRRRALLAALSAAALVAGGGGCTDDPKAVVTADVEDASDTDSPPGGRTFFLGGRAESYVPQLASRALSLAPLGDDLVEAVVVPLDLYGIPWEAFAAAGDSPPELPAAWLKAVTDAVTLAETSGRPLALALSPVTESFDQLAANASEDAQGKLDLDPTWSGYCYNPSKDGNPDKWREAYGRYAQYVARKFSPRWVFVAQRINLYEASCPESAPMNAGAYTSVAAFATAAHQRIGALETPPTTVVTVDVEDLYNFPARPQRCVGKSRADCLSERAPLLMAFEADRLGLESHPALALASLGGSIPADWLSAVLAKRPEMPSLVAATGLPPLRIERTQGACVPLVESTEALQLAWLDQVIATATARKMELVVWSSPVDLLPAEVVASCPCAGDAALCEHFGQLGAKANEVRLRVANGLVATDGTEREAASLWRQLLE